MPNIESLSLIQLAETINDLHDEIRCELNKRRYEIDYGFLFDACIDYDYIEDFFGTKLAKQIVEENVGVLSIFHSNEKEA